ncbi:glycoside hydrolase family 13 protein [Halosquirtibacter laminarini]|uniref:Glycoside hydrolase family 13 protein n=1 Tax=Halosquirtibacter laminarini TaxID=3374600 RepID=A0AC61NJ09_9BACT|nr:glycoside hydrolase family 13 protein [Prolixibacteraceae bacterium]
MKRLILSFVSMLIIGTSGFAAKYKVDHLEPMFWWTGMKSPKLELLVHGENISDLRPTINYPGVTLESVSSVENPNYLFINLIIAKETKAGSFDIQFKHGKKTILTYRYELKSRRKGSALRESYTSKDVMYLITPDRFVNGDPSNDNVKGLTEKSDRANKDGRHGGDIQGIINSLDYLADMGFTSIWVNPMLEDNEPSVTYHGYAITDFYHIDKRYGSNEDYVRLSKEAKSRGIGLIMDVVLNHCASEHWWMKDLPSKDWINFKGKFSQCSHVRTTVEDRYASKEDKKQFSDGWFVESMPDMNQRNPFLATYLTQNVIWWIEYADLEGLRIDTYPYSDKTFLSKWSKRITDEYPNINIVGEEWSTNPAIVSYWQRGKNNTDGYVSSMPSMMDFPLNTALINGLKKKENWDSGFINLYETLANDFQYPNPGNLVIFPDNHDMARIYDQLDRDFNLYKMAIAYVLTMRGVPQIYYGTEILAKSEHGGDHGYLRIDFPGGWEGDAKNAFTGKGLSKDEAAAQKFMKTLLNWRKNNSIIANGKLMHYAPQNGTYVYFRYTKKGKVMVIMNKNSDVSSLDTSRFHEMIQPGDSANDILTGETVTFEDKIQIPSRSVKIYELD